MLTRRQARPALALAVLLLAAGAGGGPAFAQQPGGGVECPPREQDCDLTAQEPGQAAPDTPADKNASGAAADAKCAIQGEEVPCSTPDMGVFNQADACYWQLRKPQPKRDDPVWGYANNPDGWEPGDPDGQLYDVTCPGEGRELAGGATVSTVGPAVDGPNLEDLAQEAVEKMRLRGADIGIAPDPGGMGLVGMPVWMWNRPGATTTGPTSESATAGSVTVTATATVAKVVWDMGDGHSVTCTKPGKPYKGEYGKAKSPECGHMYTEASDGQPDDRYKVTATTTWEVHWTAPGGQTGDITTTRESEVSVRIGEAQVLN